jgi:hypothetical protein
MLSLFRDDTGKSNSVEKILSDKNTDKNIITTNDIRDLSLELITNNPKLTFAFFTYVYDSDFEDYVMNDIVVRT